MATAPPINMVGSIIGQRIYEDDMYNGVGALRGQQLAQVPTTTTTTQDKQSVDPLTQNMTGYCIKNNSYCKYYIKHSSKFNKGLCIHWM